MALPFEYIAITIAIIFLVVGYMLDDWFFKMISSIFMLVIGVWVIMNGWDGVLNLATNTFAIIVISSAAYVMMKESYDFYKTM